MAYVCENTDPIFYIFMLYRLAELLSLDVFLKE